MASGDQAVPSPAIKPEAKQPIARQPIAEPAAAPAAVIRDEPDPSQPKPDPNMTLTELWERARSSESSFKIRKLLSGTKPIERRAGVIVVDLQEEIRHLLELSRGALESVLGRELGESVRLEITPPKAVEPTAQASDGQSTEKASAAADGLAAIEKNELVRTTMELFDAEIIEIKPARKQRQDS